MNQAGWVALLFAGVAFGAVGVLILAAPVPRGKSYTRALNWGTAFTVLAVIAMVLSLFKLWALR